MFEVVLELEDDDDIDRADGDDFAREELDPEDKVLEVEEPFEVDLLNCDEGTGQLEGFDEDEPLELFVRLENEDVAGDDLDFEAERLEHDVWLKLKGLLLELSAELKVEESATGDKLDFRDEVLEVVEEGLDTDGILRLPAELKKEEETSSEELPRDFVLEGFDEDAELKKEGEEVVGKELLECFVLDRFDEDEALELATKLEKEEEMVAEELLTRFMPKVFTEDEPLEFAAESKDEEKETIEG